MPAWSRKGVHGAAETNPSQGAGEEPSVERQRPLVGSGPSLVTVTCWGCGGSQATWRQTGCQLPRNESPSESRSLSRMDRLTSNVTATVPRLVSPTCLEVLGPARAEAPQKAEEVLQSRVVTVVGTRPRGHGLQSSKVPRPSLHSSRLPQNRRPVDLNGPRLVKLPSSMSPSQQVPATYRGVMQCPWLRPPLWIISEQKEVCASLSHIRMWTGGSEP